MRKEHKLKDDGIRHTYTRRKAPFHLFWVSLIAAFACHQDPVTAPTFGVGNQLLESLEARALGCDGQCVISRDFHSFILAPNAIDSADANVQIGWTEVAGAEGEIVTLAFESGGEALIANLSDPAQVRVTIGEESKVFTLNNFTKEYPLYTFNGTDTVRINYTIIHRTAGTKDGPSSMRLVQRTPNGARVVRYLLPEGGNQPQVAAKTYMSSTCNGTTCKATCQVDFSAATCQPPGGYSSMTVNTSPYYTVSAGYPYTFASSLSTGSSSPIYVTFSTLVQNVKVTAYDPTYFGNRVEVVNDYGSMQSWSFGYSGTPGVFVSQTQTIYPYGGVGSRVASLRLVPAPGDYVYWSIVFDVIVSKTSITPNLIGNCTMPDSLKRGGKVICTVQAQLGTSGAGVVNFRVVQRSATATLPKGYFSLTENVNTTGTSHTWSGSAVVPTSVSITADIPDGNPGETQRVTKTLTFSPQVRTFAFVLPVSEVPNDTFPPDPKNAGELGLTDFFSSRVGKYAQVPDGPNKGIQYVTGLPITMSAKIKINRTALTSGSDFWSRHPTARTNGTCSKTDVLAQNGKVEAHEGIGKQTNSHTWFFENSVVSYLPIIERQLGLPGDTTFIRTVTANLDDMVNNAYAESKKADQPAYNNNVVDCNFLWRPTP